MRELNSEDLAIARKILMTWKNSEIRGSLSSVILIRFLPRPAAHTGETWYKRWWRKHMILAAFYQIAWTREHNTSYYEELYSSSVLYLVMEGSV